MKKLIPITLTFVMAVALTIGTSFVSAQGTPATASTASNATNVKDFQDHKAKILQRINDRITKIQQIQSCVQAAEDLNALRACKPHRDKEDHGKGSHK